MCLMCHSQNPSEMRAKQKAHVRMAGRNLFWQEVVAVRVKTESKRANKTERHKQESNIQKEMGKQNRKAKQTQKGVTKWRM